MASHFSLDPADYPPGYLDESSGASLIVACALLIVLETAFVVARQAARSRKRAAPGLDDWLIWPALLANVALCTLNILIVPVAGVGTHWAAVRIYEPAKLVAWAQCILAEVWLWALAMTLPKLAILGFYLRFFVLRWERAVTYVLMAVLAALFPVVGLVMTFQCWPVAYQWGQYDGSVATGACIDQLAYYRWMSFPNILTDLAMLALPLPMVWRLQHQSRAQKLGLSVVFLTGSMGLVTACLRFAIFFHSDALRDNTWTSVELCKWTDIEPGIYLIAACMPSLRPLCVDVWRGVRRACGWPSVALGSSDGSSGVPQGRMRVALPGIAFPAGGDRATRYDHRSVGTNDSWADLECGNFTAIGKIGSQPAISHVTTAATLPSGKIVVVNDVTVQHLNEKH